MGNYLNFTKAPTHVDIHSSMSHGAKKLAQCSVYVGDKDIELHDHTTGFRYIQVCLISSPLPYCFPLPPPLSLSPLHTSVPSLSPSLSTWFDGDWGGGGGGGVEAVNAGLTAIKHTGVSRVNWLS